MKFSMPSMQQVCRSVLTAGILGTATAAYAAPNDFNADGNSDYTLVTIGSDDNLTWAYQDSISSATAALGAIGVKGDHLIPATWKGGATPEIGVVGLDDTDQVVWKILNSVGGIEQREFGSKKGSIVAGGDYNGNGFADAAAAEIKNKKVVWEISYDMFNVPVGQGSVATVTFGQSGDRIFFASPDGLTDWIGTFGADTKGRALLRLKSLTTGEVKSTTRIPKSFTKGTRPRPIPVKTASGADVLVFALPGKSDTKISVRTIDGEIVSETTLPGKGDVVVGNYTADAGEEIAIKTSSGFTTFNPFTQAKSAVATGAGIAADEVNINSFISAGNSPNPGNNNEDDGGSVPSNGNLSCNSVAPWPGSHIYKTIGSHHFTDVRRNTSGIVVKPGGRGPFPGCVNIVDTKGNVLAKMGSYPPGPGWAARFYAGIGCAAGTPFNGAKVGALARAKTGSTTVYANFGSVCYGPIDATKCIGSSSC